MRQHNRLQEAGQFIMSPPRLQNAFNTNYQSNNRQKPFQITTKKGSITDYQINRWEQNESQIRQELDNIDSNLRKNRQQVNNHYDNEQDVRSSMKPFQIKKKNPSAPTNSSAQQVIPQQNSSQYQNFDKQIDQNPFSYNRQPSSNQRNNNFRVSSPNRRNWQGHQNQGSRNASIDQNVRPMNRLQQQGSGARLPSISMDQQGSGVFQSHQVMKPNFQISSNKNIQSNLNQQQKQFSVNPNKKSFNSKILDEITQNQKLQPQDPQQRKKKIRLNSPKRENFRKEAVNLDQFQAGMKREKQFFKQDQDDGWGNIGHSKPVVRGPANKKQPIKQFQNNEWDVNFESSFGDKTQQSPQKKGSPNKQSSQRIQTQQEIQNDLDDIKVGAINPDFNKKLKEINQEAENDILFECTEGCGRTFNERALEKHVKICKKLFAGKKEKGEIKKQGKFKFQDSQNKNQPKQEPKWKKQSEQLRQIVKVVKEDDPAFKEDSGAKKGSQQQGGPLQEKTLTQQKHDLSKLETLKCQYCDKDFHAQVLSRHKPLCKSKFDFQKQQK